MARRGECGRGVSRFVVAGALLAGCARSAAPPTEPEDVEVSLESSQPKVALSLLRPHSDPERDRPLVDCKAPPCLFEIPTGQYLLHAERGPRTLPGSRLVRVDAPANISVDPDAEAQRTNGLALGLLGSAIFVAGFVYAGVEDRSGSDPQSRSYDFDIVYTALVISMFGGAIAAPGWVMYGRSFAPTVELTPRRTVRKSRPRTSPASDVGAPCDTADAVEACKAWGGACKYTGRGLACIRRAPASPDSPPR